MAKAPSFRSPTAQQMLNEAIYRGIYAGSPNAYLVLTPDFKIINGNDAFVEMARIERDVFAGRYMFHAFPGNEDEENTGVANLLGSFNRVLKLKRADTLKTQRYDVQNSKGIWETRSWDGTSFPVTQKRSITGIVLHVDEIIQSDEVSQLLHEAHLTYNRLVAEKAEQLAMAIRDGRLDQVDALRDLLREAPPTIH